MLLRAAAAWAACVLVPTAAALPGDNEPLLPGQRGSSSPVVDLGYARYAGFYDSTYNLNVWKRYVLAALIVVGCHYLEKSDFVRVPGLCLAQSRVITNPAHSHMALPIPCQPLGGPNDLTPWLCNHLAFDMRLRQLVSCDGRPPNPLRHPIAVAALRPLLTSPQSARRRVRLGPLRYTASTLALEMRIACF
jgi:hypothetical protein